MFWHAEGDFDTQDKVNAILWFQQAVDLYNAHKMESSALCDDGDEVQQAREQFIELVRQADEIGVIIINTKLCIHWFDGVDTEQDNRMTIHPYWIIGDLSDGYAIVHLAISLMKEKSARQDTNPTELVQRAHAIQRSVERITQNALLGDVEPSIVLQWGVQVVPAFPQRFYCIISTIARFML